MSKEIFKPIYGFEGLYSASNIGNVRSETRKYFNNGIKKFCTIKGKMLKPIKEKSGHLRVQLRKNGKTYTLGVHQCVLRAFVGKQEKGIECRHLDGNPIDNRLENLSYGTKAENMQDAIRHGTFPLGVNRPGAKLTPEIARKIAQDKRKICEIAKDFNINSTSVICIKRGDYWKEATEGFRYYKPKTSRKFTKEEIDFILDRNYSRETIANDLGISLWQVKRIRHQNVRR